MLFDVQLSEPSRLCCFEEFGTQMKLSFWKTVHAIEEVFSPKSLWSVNTKKETDLQIELHCISWAEIEYE